jgi:hypothetical protein
VRLVSGAYRQDAVEHVEHVVQTLVTVRDRTGEPRWNGGLGHEQRAPRVVAGGLDQKLCARAGEVSLSLARTV